MIFFYNKCISFCGSDTCGRFHGPPQLCCLLPVAVRKSTVGEHKHIDELNYQIYTSLINEVCKLLNLIGKPCSSAIFPLFILWSLKNRFRLDRHAIVGSCCTGWIDIFDFQKEPSTTLLSNCFNIDLVALFQRCGVHYCLICGCLTDNPSDPRAIFEFEFL